MLVLFLSVSEVYSSINPQSYPKDTEYLFCSSAPILNPNQKSKRFSPLLPNTFSV